MQAAATFNSTLATSRSKTCNKSSFECAGQGITDAQFYLDLDEETNLLGPVLTGNKVRFVLDRNVCLHRHELLLILVFKQISVL